MLNNLRNLIIYLLFIPTIGFSSQNTYEKILSNGLKVIVREDHRSPVVVSQVWYKVGSSYEHNGITGLSHMLEHMMFKATKNLKDQEFNKIIAENGGEQNAFTNYDYTGYYQVLQKDKLNISMRLEADRMHNLIFDNNVFQKEREVVAEERRLRTEDVPTSLLAERFYAAAFIANPYHNPVVGWMSDIKNYNLDDLKDWYKTWYAPNNAVVVVVGDVEHNYVFSMAENYFGKIPHQAVKKTKPRTNLKSLGRRDIKIEIPAKVPVLALGFNTPSLITAENSDEKNEVYALEIISAILSDGDSSRFSKNLIRNKKIATFASSSFDAFSLHSNLFTVFAAPQQKVNLNKLEQEIILELNKLKTTEVTKQELELIKTQIYTSKIYKRDSLQSQAYEIGSLEAVNLTWDIIDKYDDMLLKVTPKDIMHTAQKYLTDKNLTAAQLIPQKIN